MRMLAVAVSVAVARAAPSCGDSMGIGNTSSNHTSCTNNPNIWQRRQDEVYPSAVAVTVTFEAAALAGQLELLLQLCWLAATTPEKK